MKSTWSQCYATLSVDPLSLDQVPNRLLVIFIYKDVAAWEDLEISETQLILCDDDQNAVHRIEDVASSILCMTTLRLFPFSRALTAAL